MRRGQDYITSNLPVMHKDMAAMTQGDARVAFIRELSCPPICHNFHFYQLRRRKYDSAANIWLAICPSGLEIYEVRQDRPIDRSLIFCTLTLVKMHFLMNFCELLV